jgi:hypothetical protein
MLGQQFRASQPAQHLHHQKIPCTELTMEPIRCAQAGRQIAQTGAHLFIHHWQAFREPRFVALHEQRVFTLQHHGLDR